MAWSSSGKSLSFALQVSSPFIILYARHVIYNTHIFLRNSRWSTGYLTSIPCQAFKYEPFILAAFLLYGAFFWFGSRANSTKANSWFVSGFFFLCLVHRTARLFHLILSAWIARAGACVCGQKN